MRVSLLQRVELGLSVGHSIGVAPLRQSARAHNDAMTTPGAGPPRRPLSQKLLRLLGWSAFVVLGSAGSWFVWMGWDQTYWVDSTTGLEHGPYRVWQVITCGITLLAVAVWTSRGRYWPTVLLLPPSFTAAWSVTASEDITGLWMVGAIMVGFGSTLGTLIVLGITRFGLKKPAETPV